MNHSHTKQHYALNLDKCLTHITKADSADKQKYFCPCCHEEMVAKRGNIRQWHFAHKSEKCSYDKYLHSIAEILIMNWFNQSEQIILSIDHSEKCDKKNNCSFFNEFRCTKNKKRDHNLKEYYYKCSKEHRYKNFIADLYCENKIYPDSPIFIEIFVTHECSEEKKKSNIRIIEFVIQSEEDILNIINSTILRESEKIRLYNFKPEPINSNSFRSKFYKYVLNSNQKSYINQKYTCMDYNSRREGIYEISISESKYRTDFNNILEFLKFGRILAFIDGYLDKDCLICRWQAKDFSDNRYCKLYKRCGNPKFCKDNDSSKCSMFKINLEYLLTVLKRDNLRDNPHIDIWKSECSIAKKERQFNIASIEKELEKQKSYKYRTNENSSISNINIHTETIAEAGSNIHNENDFNTIIATGKYYCGDNGSSILDLGLICEQHIKEHLIPNFNDITDKITINFFTKNSIHKLICTASFYKSNGKIKYDIDFIDSQV